MIPRIAGIVSHRPDAVHDFLHRMTVRYAAYAPGTVQVISFPSDQPVVAIAVADGRRPQVSCYRAPDGAFVVLDGEVYDFGDELPTEVPGTGAVNQAERIFQLY